MSEMQNKNTTFEKENYLRKGAKSTRCKILSLYYLVFCQEKQLSSLLKFPNNFKASISGKVHLGDGLFDVNSYFSETGCWMWNHSIRNLNLGWMVGWARDSTTGRIGHKLLSRERAIHPIVQCNTLRQHEENRPTNVQQRLNFYWQNDYQKPCLWG